MEKKQCLIALVVVVFIAGIALVRVASTQPGRREPPSPLRIDGNEIIGRKIAGADAPAGQLRGVDLSSAHVFGRRSDLIRLFNTTDADFVFCGLLAFVTRDERYGERVLEVLPPVAPPSRIARALKPGQILVLVGNKKELLSLVTAARKSASAAASPDDGAPRGGPRRLPSGNPEHGSEEGECEEGKVCIDNEGHLTVGLGCKNGLEVEASTSGEFSLSVPTGKKGVSITFS